MVMHVTSGLRMFGKRSQKRVAYRVVFRSTCMAGFTGISCALGSMPCVPLGLAIDGMGRRCGVAAELSI